MSLSAVPANAHTFEERACPSSGHLGHLPTPVPDDCDDVTHTLTVPTPRTTATMPLFFEGDAGHTISKREDDIQTSTVTPGSANDVRASTRAGDGPASGVTPPPSWANPYHLQAHVNPDGKQKQKIDTTLRTFGRPTQPDPSIKKRAI